MNRTSFRKQILNTLLLVGLMIWLTMSMPEGLQQGFMIMAGALLCVLSLVGMGIKAIRERFKAIPEHIEHAATAMNRATIVLDKKGDVVLLNDAAKKRMDGLSERYGSDLLERVFATKAQWLGKPQAEISANLDDQILHFSISGITRNSAIGGYWVSLRVSDNPINAMNTAMRDNAQKLQQQFNNINDQMPQQQRNQPAKGVFNTPS